MATRSADRMDPRDTFRPLDLARQHAFLCRLARELLGDAARAEDVVQDAYVLALERPPRESAALGAWLGKVVRRLSLNERRRAERAQRHEHASARPAHEDSHAEAAASLDAQQRVLAAVRALDEPYRTTLWLRYCEELSPNAIAAREGLPVKTVKTRLARGLERLRAELGRERDACGGWAALLVPLARRAGATGVLGGIAMKKLVAVLGVLALALVGWEARRHVARGGGAGIAAPHSAGMESASAVERAPAAAPATATAREALAEGSEAPASEPALAGAALAVHAVWTRDGTDAADLGLVLRPRDDPAPDVHTRMIRTDAEGLARIEGLAAGSYVLHTDRDGREDVELQAGETLELELAVASGVDVSGRVVDGEGAPVAGAEIWLGRSRVPGWLGGEVVARADTAGRFALRSVGREQSLGALSRGFAPAWLVQLQERTWPVDDPRIEVTLVLDRVGATLEGRVSDPAGTPVAGALVGIGSSGFGIQRLADGRHGTRPPAWTAITDADGLFRIDGLEPATLPVNVLAEGFAPARSEAPLEAGSTAFVDVRLARGATIAGTVQDPAGEPVAGAIVCVLRAGPVDGATPFSAQQVTASGTGEFRLDRVPSGEVTLRARHSSLEFLRARSSRSVAEGAEERWDLVLAEEPSIRGLAVDANGQALAGWEIAAHAQDTYGLSSGVDTDDQGRFVLLIPEIVQGEAWTLDLLHAGAVHERLADVRAGDEVVLHGLAPEELGTLTGGFLDSAGRVAPGERVTAMLLPEERERYLAALSADVVEGRFAFVDVTPGRYRVQVRTPGAVLAESAPVELVAGSRTDFGVLSSLAAGSLVVELAAPPGVVLPDEGAYVDGDRPLVRHGGEWRTEGLEPGRHWISAWFPGLALLQRTVDVEPGRETRVAVTLEPGVERTLVCVPPPGIRCFTVDVLVRAADWELSMPVFDTQRLALSLTLGPGRYAIEASAAGGLFAETVLEIGDVSGPAAEVVLELR